MSSKENLIDKRLIDRNLRKGLINPEQYQQLLDRLVDCSDKVLTTNDETSETNSENRSASADTEATSYPANPFQPTAL